MNWKWKEDVKGIRFLHAEAIYVQFTFLIRFFKFANETQELPL